MRLGPIALLALVALARPAAANLAAVQPDPALVSAPGQVGPAGLHVVGERLAFDCTEEGRKPVCDFRAVYRVRNTTAAAQAVVAAFLGLHTERVTVRVAGRRVRHPLSDDEARRIDEAVRGVTKEVGGSRGHRDGLDRAGFRLSLEPGREVEIVASGRARPGQLFVPSYASPAVKTRHPLLGTPPRDEEYDLEYLVAPIRTWGGVGPIEVTLRHPDHWKVSLHTVGGRQPRPTRRTSGGARGFTLELDGAAVDLLQIHITLPPRLLYNGGVLLGLGGTVDEPRGFRARLGYEVAAPGWLFYALVADTDFTDELVLAATVEAATSGVFGLIPSAGVGLGVPVQVRPEATAGIRFQLTLQWPFVGFVTSLDLYPGLDPGSAGLFQATLLGQVAL